MPPIGSQVLAPHFRSSGAAAPAGRRERVVWLPATEPWTLRWLLVAMIFSAFLSGVKLIPGLATNIGPFEIVGVLLLLYYLLNGTGYDHQLPTLSKLLLAITVWAALSQLVIRPENARIGLLQTVILANLFLVVTVLHNLVRRYRLTPLRLLTLVTLAVLVAGPWVVASGISSGGDIQASGPFRNRAHVATYMLTAFWLVIVFLLHPAVRRWWRWAGFLAAASSLYAVAVSGRRSVYLALFVGLAGLAISFMAARQGRRLRMLFTATFAVAFIWLFYSYGALLFPQAKFFEARVGTIGARVKSFVSTSDSYDAESNFYLAQREGVLMAFRDSPIIGIGWGGFPRSRYSPTGHEVHSTPLRFLAELGIVGLLLYICLIGHLILESLRLFIHMRKTSYSAAYLAMALAMASLALSYLYNRHITERTFWVLLAVFLAMRSFADLVASAQQAVTAAPGPSVPRPGLTAHPAIGRRGRAATFRSRSRAGPHRGRR